MLVSCIYESGGLSCFELNDVSDGERTCFCFFKRDGCLRFHINKCDVELLLIAFGVVDTGGDFSCLDFADD